MEKLFYILDFGFFKSGPLKGFLPDFITPDWTLWIQMALFLAGFTVLHFLVFKPYLELLHARHEKTAGLKEKAIHEKAHAEKLRDDYETFMKAERKKLTQWSDEERRKIAEEERSIIQAARDQVGKELGALREKVKSEADQVRKELTPHIPEYSSLIASKLTGQKVKVTASKVDPAKESGADSLTVN